MNESAGSTPVLSCSGLKRWFTQGDRELVVLESVDFSIDAGETVSIIGASGSGKTTLLQLLGGLDNPSAGSITIAGRDMTALGDRERGETRNRMMGFVYQFHHLLPEFSAIENVAMPLLIRREPVAKSHQAAAELLERVGLGQRLDHRPGQLSGGERQRAAVARALITRPKVVLADEPTGNLDGKTGDRVFETMLELNREFATSLVVVTHDLNIAQRLDRVMTLREGRLHDGVID